ncbi:mitochondrial import inner membrane translocase subunit Tim10 B [Sarcophilus harrisii]|uniref:Mitochondrial import inner membrane translocase subunit n=1 Tax=Sarcophilus harrisii TaxID=9305 RepID=A0A7N4PKR7_SARHA|nr:mitochondrial import inner membrane translocase subunit Tim10 B [Sarcophilus harrisii]
MESQQPPPPPPPPPPPQQQQQVQQQQLRNLRDFLLVYNRMTELCFQRCVPSLHHRALDAEEEACLDSCAGKLVHSNHRLMAAYVQLMPALVQRRIADYEASAALAETAEAPSSPGAGQPGTPGPGS